MATKQFYATGDFRYGTRMLRAGDGPFPMTAPQARLYRALGKISEEKPKAAKSPYISDAPVTGQNARAAEIEAEKKASAPKPRKRARKAKK